jgi:hypothetical protein
MSPTPELQELIQSVRTEAGAGDPLARLAKASEFAASLNQLGDLLLDHFVQECREAGKSWAELSSALGVSKQAAHKRFTGFGGNPPRFERFTDRARGVLMDAIEQTKALGHPRVEPVHLLLAQYSQPAGLAALTLARLGLDREQALAAVLERTPRIEGTTYARAVPFSDDAKAVLQGTLDEALNLGHNYLGTEHLLLATQRDGTDDASQILSAAGAGREQLRSILVELIQEFVRKRDELKGAAES